MLEPNLLKDRTIPIHPYPHRTRLSTGLTTALVGDAH